MRPTPIDLLEHIPDGVLAALRERMSQDGFVGTVFPQIEYVLPAAPDRARLPLMRRLLEQSTDRWAGYCLLFNYSGSMLDADARILLGHEVCDALRDAGVLVPDADSADRLRSTLRIMPFLGLWIAGDPPDAGEEAVMVPGQTTMQLALLMPDRCVGNVLDLGCGPGALALVAARRGAARAVGVDINERAIRMARVNARLNGVTAEFLAGDMYAPVYGERFELVVAQPPYVIEPDQSSAVVFLHAGPRGEILTLRALAGMPSALAPSGKGLLLADAPLPPSGSLSSHFRKALGSDACDLVVATAPAPPIELQSFAYAQVDDASLGARYAESACRYLDHLRKLDPPGFRQVAIMVRSRDGSAGGRQALTASFPVCGFGGARSRGIDRFFAAVDLAATPPETLRQSTLRLNGNARWYVESDRPVIDGEVPWNVRFNPGALGVDQSLPHASVAMLHFVDRAADVEGGLAAYAEACAATVEEIAVQALDFVRHALRSGLVVSADESAGSNAGATA